MAAAGSSSCIQVLSLYRTMLRESKKFSSYSYRNFALRRIREAFQENKNETNPEIIQELIEKAKSTNEIIQRQVLIGHLYTAQKLVIEGQ
ncbi:LYR motif-containing protein 4 [Leucoraja erinacea]|uniref:LYR motif-containing protein 4 n=1 Tax=Leucoraja erinaceus TaxID=7782 RepID=UPI002456E36E|nr:LYR motif-containing protein 4 [Leucoraja erinacea]